MRPKYKSRILAAVLCFALAASEAAAKRILFGERLCGESGFTCVTAVKGDTWESLWPDAEAREAIRRLNRVNIRLRPGLRVAIPDDERKIKLDRYAPFPKRNADVTEKTLFFDPVQLAWGAYDAEGKLVRWGPASGGNDWCADIGRSCRTPSGEYRVMRRGGAECRSGTYPRPRGGARMPYCVFFKSGYAFHGSPEVPGYNASHGCVRLFNEDARWINEEFADLPAGESPGTRVIILEY